MVGIGEFCGMDVGIFHQEFLVFLPVAFPADCALGSVFRCADAAFGDDFFDTDIALLLAGCGDGQVGTEEHAGGKEFLLQLHRCPDADAVGHGTVFSHLSDGDVQAAVGLGTGGGAFHTCHDDTGPMGKAGSGLAQGREETVEDPHLSLYKDPADAPFVQVGIQLGFRKVRNLLPDDLQGFLLCVGKFRRQQLTNLLLNQKVSFQGIRKLVFSQTAVDQPDGFLIKTSLLAAADIFGKAELGIFQSVIDIHSLLLVKKRSRPQQGGSA